MCHVTRRLRKFSTGFFLLLFFLAQLASFHVGKSIFYCLCDSLVNSSPFLFLKKRSTANSSPSLRQSSSSTCSGVTRANDHSFGLECGCLQRIAASQH